MFNSQMSQNTWDQSFGLLAGKSLSVRLSVAPSPHIASTYCASFPVIAAFLIIFADLALAIPGNNNYPWKIVKFFWLDGMTYDNEIGIRNPREGPNAKPIPFFLAALGFFKVFLTFGYLSQSFYGLDAGLNEWGESEGPNTQLFCLWAGECKLACLDM